jgi:hypothetical protein
MRCALFRRSFDELAESVIPELARVGFGEPLGARWDAGKHDLLFANGSVLRLRYLESIVDASRRQGGQYQLLLFEERTLLSPGIAEIVMERLRTTTSSAVPVLGVRCTSNPGNSSHSEVKARYIESTHQGREVAIHCAACQEFVVAGHCKCTTPNPEQRHTVRFIPAKVADNPHVDPGYVARLMAIPDPARRAAMLDGSWDSFGGQVFTEWRHDRHVVEPFPLPESWVRWAGIDYGQRNPWAVVWAAVDEDGRVWIYREAYQTELGEREQARRILAAEEGGRAVGNPDDNGKVTDVPEPPSLRYIDPATAARRGDAQSILTAYLEAGCAVTPANNDRLSGIARVHTYLADATACSHHRALGWDRCPLLHVFAGCKHLIRTLPSLPRDPKRPEDVDTDADDHLYDALRYCLMALGTQAVFHVVGNEAYDAIHAEGAGVRRPLGGFALPEGYQSPFGGDGL